MNRGTVLPWRRRDSFSEVLRELDALVARGAWSSGINRRPTPLHALPSIVGDHSLCGSSGFVPYPDGEDDLFLAAGVVVGDVPRKNLSD